MGRRAARIRSAARSCVFATAIGTFAAQAFAGPTPPNILLIIADDLGVEQLAPFGIGTAPADTPVLDQLARDGIRFSHTWAQPVCSPSRATMLTGRYAFRTGVGGGVSEVELAPKPDLLPIPDGSPREVQENLRNAFSVLADYIIPRGGTDRKGPSETEVALPQVLKDSADYRTAAIGKWHMADGLNGGMSHATNAGFDHVRLTMHNQPESYFSWLENVDGTYKAQAGYTAEAKVDAALDWINGAATEQPWFMWLAFNLPHYPHHIPANQADADPENAHLAVDSMTAQMDAEIGRLLTGLSPEERDNTYVIFVGDNGTTSEAIDPPFRPDGAKFTVYEGGLRVPLLISGPDVPSDVQVDAMVNTTDIFGTIVELAGAELPSDLTTDSVSLRPYFNAPDTDLRDFAFAEHFTNYGEPESGGFAIRDARWKLIRTRSTEALYDLSVDPYEDVNLLADGQETDEAAIVARLMGQVETLWNSED